MKGYFNAAALQAGTGPLWVCEGAFDALALLAAGVSRVVAIFGVQGWRWEWTREVREFVFALDADTAGQQQWRQFARQAALRGKQIAGLEPAAYGGCKDASEGWAAGVLAVGSSPRRASHHPTHGEGCQDFVSCLSLPRRVSTAHHGRRCPPARRAMTGGTRDPTHGGASDETRVSDHLGRWGRHPALSLNQAACETRGAPGRQVSLDRHADQ